VIHAHDCYCCSNNAVNDLGGQERRAQQKLNETRNGNNIRMFRLECELELLIAFNVQKLTRSSCGLEMMHFTFKKRAAHLVLRDSVAHRCEFLPLT